MFENEINFIRNFILNLDIIFENALLSYEGEITRLNKENLSKGKTSEGDNIKPDYSPDYAKKKGKKTPDLFINGSFYDSIFVTTTNEPELLVTSNLNVKGFELADHLSKRYTVNIYGITDQQAEVIKNKAIKKVIKIFNNGLK